MRELGETTKAAVRLAVAQARRTHLTTVALPAAYRELGRDIIEAGRFETEFPDLFDQIKDARQERARLQSLQGDRERGKTLSEKASDAAARAKSSAQAKMLALKEESLLRQLGECSYDRHGKASGQEHLVQPINECRAGIEQRDRRSTASPRSARGGSSHQGGSWSGRWAAAWP